ncbi:MAG: SusC/RagA family TonB-linked outer membrane protein [Paludibacter sp.]|nr:SusC/RagA family TonB-linked outer membrane protein [Paludibacter sp.]
MRKYFYLLILLVFTPLCVFAQKSISGVVIDEGQEPLIGVSVVVKGTTTGTITDLDGNYILSNVPNTATIVFSYVGMQTQEQKITPTTSVLNITMRSDALVIDEVVVTAMGIQQEKKRMNFAVQSVGAETLTENKSPNFVNALQGKISGLSVTNSSGSPNSGTQVIIRGISSVNNGQNNEPLFILDGMPVSGNGSSAADINPNDIENVTVLKGAAAAALYGQEAANGVIMITTKKGQAGKVIATVNAGWQYDIPTRLQQLQTSYAPGSQGFYVEKAMGGWGPLLNDEEKIYDNVNGFLKNGLYQKYDISLSGGSEKFQAYASANYSKNDGIVPNDYLNKLGILVKGTYQPLKSLTFTVSANIQQNTYRSFSSTGMSSVYNYPINRDITDYQYTNGYPKFLYYADGDGKKHNSPMSPLYSRYNDYGINKKLRNILNGSVEWKPIRNLNITGRVSYDTNTYAYDGYSLPRFDDSVILPHLGKPEDPAENATPAELAQYQADMDKYMDFLDKYANTPYLSSKDIADMDKDILGAYSTSMSRGHLLTASALGTYKIELEDDFSIDLLAGADMRMEEGFSTSNAGRDFIIPGTYSLSNTNSEYIFLGDRTASHRLKNMYGYFGEIRGDYKGLASLSITSRWDWSSTIIKNPFYYPSITGGLLFSELFNLSNDVFSYGKLRGNYAVVGKDAGVYLYDRRYKQFATYPDNGYGIDPTLSSADRNLTPEMSYSWEIGADLRFFDSKTRLDLAYYSVKADNQIVTVRVSPSSGYILQTRNEGAIRNHGIELTLDQDIIKNRDFSWITTFNLGINRGTVVSLPDDVAEITGAQYGDIYTSAYLGGSTTGLSGKDYLRTAEGKIIVGSDGYPKIDPNKNKYIGNREPLFQSGITNTIKYKDMTLSFLFEGRLGGDVVNVTGRGLISNGQSKMLETYRGRQIVVDGVVEQSDGSYEPNTTPITLDYQTISNYFYAVSSNFVEDGSYVRLSYVTLNYDLSKLVKGSPFTGLRCSLTGNNLFLLTKYTGADPSLNANTSAGGTGSAGIDNYAVPNTTSFNFGITATF